MNVEELIRGLEAFLAADVGRLVALFAFVLLVGSGTLIGLVLWIANRALSRSQKQPATLSANFEDRLFSLFNSLVMNTTNTLSRVEAIIVASAHGQEIVQEQIGVFINAQAAATNQMAVATEALNQALDKRGGEHEIFMERQADMVDKIQALLRRLDTLPEEILAAMGNQCPDEVITRIDELERTLKAEIEAALIEAQNGLGKDQNNDT